MDELADWVLDNDPEEFYLTENRFRELPEEVQQRIEVIDGLVILCRSGGPTHNIVARSLADEFDAAMSAEQRMWVLTYFEMRYWISRPTAQGFSFRRPDVVVARRIPGEQKLRTRDVLVAVEVISPGSEYVDTVHKWAEYANQGIPLYLTVHLDDDLRVDVIQEYRLDWSSGTYNCVHAHQGVLELRDPFPVTVNFSELDD
jgi:Uma2 family endonuclease